jgi:hypothetical protein
LDQLKKEHNLQREVQVKNWAGSKNHMETGGRFAIA